MTALLNTWHWLNRDTMYITILFEKCKIFVPRIQSWGRFTNTYFLFIFSHNLLMSNMCRGRERFYSTPPRWKVQAAYNLTPRILGNTGSCDKCIVGFWIIPTCCFLRYRIKKIYMNNIIRTNNNRTMQNLLFLSILENYQKFTILIYYQVLNAVYIFL